MRSGSMLGVAVGASVTLLFSGCSAESALPPDATPEEILAYGNANAGAGAILVDGGGRPITGARVTMMLSSNGNVRQQRALDACMVKAGYPDGIGFAPSSGANNQSDLQFALQRQVAQQNCFASPSVLGAENDLYRGLLGTAQRKYVYAYYVDWLVPCLVQHGFGLRTAPTQDQFVRSWKRQGWWTPYASLSNQPQNDAQLDWLEQQCAPMPVGFN